MNFRQWPDSLTVGHVGINLLVNSSRRLGGQIVQQSNNKIETLLGASLMLGFHLPRSKIGLKTAFKLK